MNESCEESVIATPAYHVTARDSLDPWNDEDSDHYLEAMLLTVRRRHQPPAHCYHLCSHPQLRD